MSEKDGNDVKSVVVTFKCSPKFKGEIDKFSKKFDSRSEMIRLGIRMLIYANSGAELQRLGGSS